MKAAVSLVLVLVPIVQAVQVTAQERVDTTAGPIRLAMTRGAIRLAAQAAHPLGKQADPAEASWPRASTTGVRNAIAELRRLPQTSPGGAVLRAV